MFTKTIKKKNPVKTYFSKFKKGKPEDKFYVAFEDNTKAMLPAVLFSLIQEGSQIDFEGELGQDGWINKIEVKSTGSSTTTSSSSVSNPTPSVSTTTISVPSTPEERIQVEVDYITRPKISGRGNEYVMAKFLKGQSVENVYLPTKAIPVTIHDLVLSGFGTMDISGNRSQRDGTFFVSTMHDFIPTTKDLVSEVEIKNCNFRIHTISFMDTNGNYVTIPKEQVPFSFSPVFEKIKSEFKGIIKVIGSFKKTGKWKKNKTTKKWELQTNWSDDSKITYDFSGVDTDGIKKIENKYVQDLEYARILAHLKQTTAFRSFAGIKKMFTDKGLSITTQEIERLYWDEKYDKEYYNTLKRKADEIFVSESEFVFIIRMEGREFRIVERPVCNSATYIFNDTCEIALLLERLKITGKFDIIRNAMTDKGEQLQTILGYKGRVVHQDYEGWVSKIQTTIGDGIEKELIDKFIW